MRYGRPPAGSSRPFTGERQGERACQQLPTVSYSYKMLNACRPLAGRVARCIGQPFRRLGACASNSLLHPSPVNGRGYCVTLPAGWLPSPVYGRGRGVRRGIRGACSAPGERHTAVAVCAPCKGGRANNCRQCHTVTKCSIFSVPGTKSLLGFSETADPGNPPAFRCASCGLRWLGLVEGDDCHVAGDRWKLVEENSEGIAD